MFFTRGTLLLVFAAALLGKVHSASAWSSFVVATKSLLGIRQAAGLWAAATVALETATVVCLILNVTAYIGLSLALTGSIAFLAVVVNGLRRGVETSCNCFGSEGAELAWSHALRNALLVGVAALGVGAASGRHIPTLLANGAYATPIVLSVIAAAAFVMWDDVRYLVVAHADDGVISMQKRG